MFLIQCKCGRATYKSKILLHISFKANTHTHTHRHIRVCDTYTYLCVCVCGILSCRCVSISACVCTSLGMLLITPICLSFSVMASINHIIFSLEIYHWALRSLSPLVIWPCVSPLCSFYNPPRPSHVFSFSLLHLSHPYSRAVVWPARSNLAVCKAF